MIGKLVNRRVSIKWAGEDGGSSVGLVRSFEAGGVHVILYLHGGSSKEAFIPYHAISGIFEYQET